MGPSDHFTRMWTRCDHCKLFGTGCHVIGTCYILGRAFRINETLPDFREWCRVTRRPQVFYGLTDCQQDTSILGRHIFDSLFNFFTSLIFN